MPAGWPDVPPIRLIEARGESAEVDRTCRDYVCPVCGREIPRGTEASELVIESLGASMGHGGAPGRGEGSAAPKYRRVYHKDCAMTEGLASKRCRWSRDLWVQRGVTEVIYHIGGREEVRIPLLPGDQLDPEAWERAVKKYKGMRDIESKGFGLRSDRRRAAE